MIRNCNIRNYSIYLQAIDGKYFSFSYFEYTGADFDADMQKMEADSTTQRWWKETAPTQLPSGWLSSMSKFWRRSAAIFSRNSIAKRGAQITGRRMNTAYVAGRSPK